MAARRPSSVKVGGIRMSTMATSGRSPLDRLPQRLGIADGVGDDEAPVDEAAGPGRRAGWRSPRR